MRTLLLLAVSARFFMEMIHEHAKCSSPNREDFTSIRSLASANLELTSSMRLLYSSGDMVDICRCWRDATKGPFGLIQDLQKGIRLPGNGFPANATPEVARNDACRLLDAFLDALTQAFATFLELSLHSANKNARVHEEDIFGSMRKGILVSLSKCRPSLSSSRMCLYAGFSADSLSEHFILALKRVRLVVCPNGYGYTSGLILVCTHFSAECRT